MKNLFRMKMIFMRLRMCPSAWQPVWKNFPGKLQQNEKPPSTRLHKKLQRNENR